MKSIVLSQRKERDRLLEKSYLQRDYQTEAEKFLASPLIKLITGPRRAGKSVLTLLLLKGKNFAYLNFDDEQLLSKFNEDTVMQALQDIREADTLIVAGTSLTVYPAASYIRYFGGSHMVLINRDATPYDHTADLVIHDKVGEVLSQMP